VVFGLIWLCGRDKGGISHLILVFGLETSRMKSSLEQNSPSYLGTGPSLEIGGTDSSLAHAVSKCFILPVVLVLCRQGQAWHNNRVSIMTRAKEGGHSKRIRQ
jgi:hypothetical protein